MALVAAGLKAAIIAELGAADDATKQAAFAEALANAIITYLVANTLVTVATTGSAAAQTGTGTIS